ncbi:MAG: small subunit ribosomal protein S9 [Rickettsiales bacterium]|jgi:small subunit ribosomal protein S9
MSNIKEAIIEATNIINTENTAEIRERIVDNLDRSYSTGKRKNSIAKVWIKKGTGKFELKGKTKKIKDLQTYFGREILCTIVNQPLVATGNENKFDIQASLIGGGLSGQAGALLLGISKALVCFDPETHKALRAAGFLTRDSRVVERKKYGLKKARKAQTYRKR